MPGSAQLLVEEFVPEVPEWREKYLENNQCALKVEAFIQRKWDSACMGVAACKERHPQVERIIEELRGRGDIDALRDIEVVYRWGGGFGPRLFTQIEKANRLGDIRKRIGAAYIVRSAKGTRRKR